MATKNPKRVFPTFKTKCLTKAQMITDFIEDHSSESISADEGLELKELRTALKVQFARMEENWDSSMLSVEDDIVFDEVEEIMTSTRAAVDKALAAAWNVLKKKSSGQNSNTGGPPSGESWKSTVKLPAFYTGEPEIWFSQSEARFRAGNVTTEVQKFNLVAAQLDESTAVLASDILKTVPQEDGTPYTKLKGRILEALSLSTNEKADKLIAMNGFGDKIPSQGLQAMLKLVPEGEAENPGFLFRRFFLLQLTADVRNSLAQTEHTASTVDSLRLLAKQADHYYHSTGARINAIAASGGSDVEEWGVDAVAGKVLCQFHKKFGHKAWTCLKNRGKRCDWTGKLATRPQGNANGRA